MNGERDGGGGEVRKGRREREIAIYIIGKKERRKGKHIEGGSEEEWEWSIIMHQQHHAYLE